MPSKNMALRAARGRQRGIRREFGDGNGRMTDREWREAWEAEVWPKLVPGCIGFLVGALCMACFGGAL